MAINKVVYNNETLIDISSDTVTADKLGYGITAHDSSGQRITGTVNMSGATNIPTKVSDLDNDAGFIQNGTVDDVTFGGNVAVSNNGFLKIVQVTFLNTSTTVASSATGFVSSSVNINAGTGWTPIAIAGFNIAGTTSLTPVRLRIEDGQVKAVFKNVHTASVTVTNITVHVLCVRTSFT